MDEFVQSVHVGYTVFWYQLEGGRKSCRCFDCDAPVFFRAKIARN